VDALRSALAVVGMHTALPVARGAGP
jgi:hypothetical protein